MYVLTGWPPGDQPKIKIDADRYGALKDALAVQHVALELEEKYHLVIENYEEFEREIFALTLAYMVRNNLTWSSMSDARLLLSRRIVNLLATCRLYVDQAKHSVSSSQLGGCTLEQAEALFSEQYDKIAGYRIMEALRNHIQHRSLAISGISYPGHIESGTTDEPLWSFRLDLKLDIKVLREDESFKIEILEELESLPPTQNDIILFIRQYVEGLGHAQNQLRKLIEPAVDRADAVIDAALTKAAAAGRSTTGLVASNLCDGSTAEEHVVVTDNLKTKRVELVAAHNSFTNLSRRFVSSVRPHGAYPPCR